MTEKDKKIVEILIINSNIVIVVQFFFVARIEKGETAIIVWLKCRNMGEF